MPVLLPQQHGNWWNWTYIYQNAQGKKIIKILNFHDFNTLNFFYRYTHLSNLIILGILFWY